MRYLFIFGYIFVEVYSLMLLADLIGGLLTVLWIFGAAALGFWLIRESGRENLQRMMMGLEAGVSPQQSLLDSFFVMFAGILLILPGAFSDVVALLLLIPHFRRLFFGRTAKYMESKGQQFYSGNTTFFRMFGGPGSSGFSGSSGFPGSADGSADESPYENQRFSYRQHGYSEDGRTHQTMDAEYIVREQTPRKTTAVIIESEVLDSASNASPSAESPASSSAGASGQTGKNKPQEHQGESCQNDCQRSSKDGSKGSSKGGSKGDF